MIRYGAQRARLLRPRCIRALNPIANLSILSGRTNYTKSGSTKCFIELQTNTVKTFEHVTDRYHGAMITKTHFEPTGYICTFNTVLLNNVLHYKSASRQPSMMFRSGDARCESNWTIHRSPKQQSVVTHGYTHFYRRQKTPIFNRTTGKCVMFQETENADPQQNNS